MDMVAGMAIDLDIREIMKMCGVESLLHPLVLLVKLIFLFLCLENRPADLIIIIIIIINGFTSNIHVQVGADKERERRDEGLTPRTGAALTQ